MTSKAPSYSRSLRTIRKQFAKQNGKSNDRTAELVITGSELISKNMYDASESPETFEFLKDLIDRDMLDRAKNIIDLMVDLYPKHVSKNTKFGDALKKLAKKGDSQYALDLIDKLIFGKVDNGPSLPPMAEEIASNDSVLSALNEIAKEGKGSQVTLLIHRLAIMAPKALKKNQKLDQLFETLRDQGFEAKVDMFNSLLTYNFQDIARS